eukprot:TRINITY_DN6101_c0_g1_i1.p1 TRINITY_DN6101_c0_g1~~TRINITY_DN6101_c0_g1_i1.p1  ORF type:complete len:202 (-),score=37.63 TRINITY_DN6101_c0_g1_i1:69-674(-)
MYVLYWIVHRLILVCFEILCLLHDVVMQMSWGIEDLEKEIGKLKKHPKHIAFILNRVSELEVADLIYWSMEADVTYISIYDVKGEGKAQSHLIKTILKQKCPSKSIHWDATPVKAGEHAYVVRFLSMQDGRGDLVRIAKQFCQETEAKTLRPMEITKNLVQLNLSTSGIPEPELLVVSNPTLSLKGIHPRRKFQKRFFWRR